MQGYYKNPESTARVLRDGWLNTGDIGMVTFNDCLKILGTFEGHHCSPQR